MKWTKDTIIGVVVKGTGAAFGVVLLSPYGANIQVIGAPFLGISLAHIIGAGIGIIAGTFLLEKMQQ